jgi:hypothetical protein
MRGDHLALAAVVSDRKRIRAVAGASESAMHDSIQGADSRRRVARLEPSIIFANEGFTHLTSLQASDVLGES